MHFQHGVNWFEVAPPYLGQSSPAPYPEQFCLISIAYGTLTNRDVATQVEIGSKPWKQFIAFELQALKQSAVNPGSAWGQPAPAYRDDAFCALSHVSSAAALV